MNSDPGKEVILTLSNRLSVAPLPGSLRDEMAAILTLENPKYTENERMGRWNRGTPKTLRFYRKQSGAGICVPRGFVRSVMAFLSRHQLPWRLVDNRRSLADVDFDFSGRLKPFQQEAAAMMLRKEFGTLCAPTGAGKTVIALYMIAQRRQPAVVIVHTKDLALQWQKRASVFLGIPEKEVGLVGGGHNRMGEKLTIALVQSLYRKKEEVARQCGFVVVDECHRTPSRTFTEALGAFDARFMLGLSATPWRRDRLSKLIFWHLGDVHHTVQQRRLVESGDVLSAEVMFRETDFKPFHDPVTEYTKMLTELTANDARNRLITDDVAREVQEQNGVCLVLTDRKKHAQTLCMMLRFKHHLQTAVLTGDLSTRQRQAVLEQIEAGAVEVLVATGQLVGEGFDCKDLSTLFLATPIRFSGRVLQYLGRVLRPAPGKVRARVFDYLDVHVDVLCAAARARQRTYGVEVQPT